MEQIFGFIERITFYNPENGFTVARLKQPRKQDLTTLVGVMPNLQPGESVRCQGNWKTDSKHGVQFEVQQFFIEAPSDKVGIQKYLESGLIRGIGPAFAKKIVTKFGTETLNIIEQTPEKLTEVEGIGKKRVETITHHWAEQKSIRNIMVFLQKYGVSPAYAQKIYKHFGNETIERMQENPYSLARFIRGIGFKTADHIATQMGFPQDAVQRKDAAIEYILEEQAGAGHTCFPLEELLVKTQEMLGVTLRDRIDALALEGVIIKKSMQDKEYVWSRVFFLSEQGIAREMKRLQSHKTNLRKIDTHKAACWVEKKLNLKLADNQREAVQHALEDKVHIITGGPGTGKSTITKAILAITEKLTSKILLAAPTGRAAKRMHEITGKMAFTIHALLQYDFKLNQFSRNRDNPLDCDLLIVDEASMIDTPLMYHLLKATPSHARLLIIGDVNQLPSVGPGNVLKDFITSAQFPVTTLTQIFRQAAGSRIITNAHKINQGEFPDISRAPKSDFFFVKAQEAEDVLREILDLVSIRLPKFYRLDPIEDIQVLSPMKRSMIGIHHLNRELQKILNPSKDVLIQGPNQFAVGDKVMQIKNNYNKDVFNGDIGRISSLNIEDQELTVNFDGKYVTYALMDLEEIVLAYAASIHKFQGSECKCVVIPMHTCHYMMLRRNLIYTGITRGKTLVVLVGTAKALAIGIQKNDALERYTGLLQALQL